MECLHKRQLPLVVLSYFLSSCAFKMSEISFLLALALLIQILVGFFALYCIIAVWTAISARLFH